jgi:Glutaminase
MKTKLKTIKESALVTLAAIRTPKRDGVTEYLFNERERIFALKEGGRSFEESSRLLKRSLESKLPVRAVFDSRRDLIEKVTVPSSEEIDEFHRGRVLLDKPEKALRIDVNTIDPTKFNVVDHYLKFPVFRLCTRVIPNYTTAKSIFDYCAQQSCSLPGPYSVSPCIPFQYVRDGCYARAHKMRWIITTKYRYCCEKVFSFANEDNDTLAVKADKWGGCCVTWWYHVAPLVRVNVRLGKWSVVLALVIDPGMFNKPVLLSTWLSAQANSVCSSNANVSKYSIQPGSAYSPANYAGTAFTTDPSYTATDATLIAYKNLTTCP